MFFSWALAVSAQGWPGPRVVTQNAGGGFTWQAVAIEGSTVEYVYNGM